MLQHIPTHVIAGPLGAGKTSLIRDLLNQRPDHERWAVLINEFGQIGLDAALLAREESGIAIGEVAGGCVCCVTGVPFQVGLSRLLRRARPTRLFIELSGLGHPLQLMAQLRQSPWTGILHVQPLVMVLDAQALARGDDLPQVQRQACAEAGLLVLNKSRGLTDELRLGISAQFSDRTAIWADRSYVSLDMLPISSTAGASPQANATLPVDSGPMQVPALWTSPHLPICLAQGDEAGWSIGWRWQPGLRLDETRLRAVLQGWPWRRAKGVIHGLEGWRSFNGLDGGPLEWRASEWRKDSRVELIFDEPQAMPALQQAMADCGGPH
ncbi:cobalamin biosynthesis protein CobW [Pseudomonas sp. S75]|uniref:CobW-like GTP-binding protein n=1 Tax=unclassified Pseudomonas TaxID=196821 RepID=UPI0019062309|nr:MULTISPECIES: CobW-like GTP-binding protein [unclassified Pseudomonas]MBJ9974422.1 cobalamin biosynthesis protein CobW [Pseudomonas sp. S30]MBK0154269.1 cobalamin biosynthesis protein CobW [Pseudomonas sp. S75]